jgi:formate--tetrahydrofolate ligase
MRPIADIVRDIGLAESDVSFYGPHAAKLTHAALRRLTEAPPRGQLVLVSALTPTKYGEGKTTTSVALAQGLHRIGRSAIAALREPSMGPIFGAKGGGTGGGKSTLEPSAQINLHFTGDLHAVSAANNLLAALTDNAMHFRLDGAPDARKVSWRRVMDMNERSLRNIVIGLGGATGGVPREASFDITAASEIMASLCLASSFKDLKVRLGRLIVGYDAAERPCTATALGATGAMAAILADAALPNIVQTTDGVPALVHGGPFANIAHGCSSVLSTKAALALADIVVTEAGFAFDLGGEKFFDVKCRTSGLWPSAVVLVVTSRALRAHGGDADLTATGDAITAALTRGMVNVDRHVRAVGQFGFQPVIAINAFDRDSDAELLTIERLCAERGLLVARHEGFAKGGAGTEALARAVATALETKAPAPRFLYPLEATFEQKVEAVASRVYGAQNVHFESAALKEFARATALGFGDFPICVAKTHLSLSDDPSLGGDPPPFTLHVRDARLRAGAGFMLVLTGEIQTLPALPKKPAAFGIDATDDGEVIGVR